MNKTWQLKVMLLNKGAFGFVFLRFGRRPRPEKREVLTIFSERWVYYDKRGVTMHARGKVAEGTFSSQAPCAAHKEEHGHDAQAPWQLGKLRRVPWQTPHTFSEDGELQLTEAAEGWLKKAMKERKTLAEEAKAEAGESDFEVDGSLRAKWLIDQEKMEEIRRWLKDQPDLFRRSKVDGLVERYIQDKQTGREYWVPVVPDGHAAGHVSWRYWVFLQVHIGVFGGHRSAEQTARLLKRIVWWPVSRLDIDGWVEKCMTCIRFRKRPTKQDAVSVKPVDGECWEEVMIDMEGPSNPADKAGNRYVMTYICCLCHGVL